MRKVILIIASMSVFGISSTAFGQLAAQYQFGGYWGGGAQLGGGFGGSADLGLQAHNIATQASWHCPIPYVRCPNQFHAFPGGNLFLNLGMGLGGIMGGGFSGGWGGGGASASSGGSIYSAYGLRGSRSSTYREYSLGGGSDRSKRSKRSKKRKKRGSTRSGSDKLTTSLTLVDNSPSVAIGPSNDEDDKGKDRKTIEVKDDEGGRVQGRVDVEDEEEKPKGRRGTRGGEKDKDKVTRTRPPIDRGRTKQTDDFVPPKRREYIDIAPEDRRWTTTQPDREPEPEEVVTVPGDDPNMKKDEETEAVGTPEVCPDDTCGKQAGGTGAEDKAEDTKKVVNDDNECRYGNYEMFGKDRKLEADQYPYKLKDDISKCIERSQLLSMHKSTETWTKCENPNDKPDINAKWKPCVNAHYVDTVIKSFKESVACIKSFDSDFNPRNILPGMNHESRYHVNQINPQGRAYSVGITQLVTAYSKEKKTFTGGMDDVEKNLWKINNSAACHGLKEHLTKESVQSVSKSDCHLINPKDNPDRAMIYGMLAYSTKRTQMRNYIDNAKKFDELSQFCGEGVEFTGPDKKILNDAIEQLSMVAYHTGSAELANSLCSFKKQNNRPFKKTDFAFSAKGVGAFFKTAPGSSKAVAYAEKVRRELEAMESGFHLDGKKQIETAFHGKDEAISCSAF